VASVTLNTTAPRQRDTLVATVTASDADLDAMTFTYVWKVNGVVHRTTTTALTQDAFSLEKSLGHKGDEIVVEVTANDGEASGETTSALAVVPQEKGRRH
jgi:hypothetical protein